jgi:prevent-host-death family protein
MLHKSRGHAEAAPVRTYPLHEARAEFSKLVERALNGEPQRVTRYGKEAVVIVAEAEWSKGPRRSGAATLGDLLAGFAERVGFDEDLFSEPIAKQERPLGSDLLADDG